MLKKNFTFLIAGICFVIAGCNLIEGTKKNSGNEAVTLLDLTKIKTEKEEQEAALEEEKAAAEKAQAEKNAAEQYAAELQQQLEQLMQILTEQQNQEQGQEPGPESESGTNLSPEPELEPEPEPEPEPELSPMPELPEPKKLTLMIYMAADNDLESHAIQNLKAMEHSDFDNMNILVLLDRAEGYDETNGDWTDTRLFEVVHDETDGNYIVSRRLRCPILSLSTTTQTELDMGNFNVLRNFITFCKNEYEAQKYALIIWGHGTGWRYAPDNIRAVAVDDNGNNYICVSELGRALKNQGISVIGFDTCFGGVFENVYEIRNCAAYSVASPGVTPAEGWNYKQLLEEISDSDFLTQTIANAMANSALVSTTVFDNSRLQTLMDNFENFSESLPKTVVDTDSRNSVFYSLLALKTYSYSQYPCDLYLDLYSMAEFYAQSLNTNLAENARVLKASIIRAANTTKAEKVEIGIHFIPKDKSGAISPYHSQDYKKDYNKTDQCQFIKESQWWVPTTGAGSDSLLDKLFYKYY